MAVGIGADDEDEAGGLPVVAVFVGIAGVGRVPFNGAELVEDEVVAVRAAAAAAAAAAVTAVGAGDADDRLSGRSPCDSSRRRDPASRVVPAENWGSALDVGLVSRP